MDLTITTSIDVRAIECNYDDAIALIFNSKTSIRDLRNGYIENFLGEDTLIFNGIRRLLVDLCPSISKANLLALERYFIRIRLPTVGFANAC